MASSKIAIREPKLISEPDAQQDDIQPEYWGDRATTMYLNACAQNLAGHKCRGHGPCVKAGYHTICPDFRRGLPCPSGKDWGWAHVGYIHRNAHCHAVGDDDCTHTIMLPGKEGNAGEDVEDVAAPCKQQAKLYHIRSTCKSVLRGEECNLGDECHLGHDFPEERRKVEERRKEEGIINREQSTLRGGQEKIKIAAKKIAVEKVAADEVAANGAPAEKVAAEKKG
ncbi:hypothetical protein LTR70_005134 [Exophiala xenobiotica]|uniref:C3H1-type domain-containing protein n=1 Tax=Lithohypha guttulata TaxID=1690604 RepID=A0ABR0KB38_9EURO|nr:hypothetical protein LTR24_004859 [Lithohypha guttulata]KAK5319232.1 hypothetical protein LTR70_005134 [Exophiala xenobiotica]